MGTFFVYSIKVAVCLTAFYLLYKLLLSRDTFHRFNRCALIGMILVSLALPCVHLHTAHPTTASVVLDGMETLIAEAVTESEAQPTGLSFTQTLFLIYIIGVAVFVVRELWSLFSLCLLLRKGRKMATDDGLRLVVVDENVSPFSWFGNIIISRKDYEKRSREILLHEKAHAHGHHSADILLCDVLIIFQWLNPSAWLLKRELQAVHEYEADEAVLSGGVCAADYQLLLIRKAVGERMFSMANNLNQCSIKKRIAMMMTKKSNKWSRAKLLVSLPVAAVAVVAFANPEVESISNEWSAEGDGLVAKVGQHAVATATGEQGDETLGAFVEGLFSGLGDKAGAQSAEMAQNEGASADSLKKNDGEPTCEEPQVLPEFPGGMNAMLAYVAKEMKYPEASIKAEEQGRVVVQFSVDVDGTICEPTIMRSVSPALDAEALRIVKSMPKWTPGMENGKAVKCKFVLPVKFSLTGDDNDGGKAKNNITASTSVKSNGKTVNNAHIYMLDGKRITEAELKDIKPETIESMQILKGKSATDKYGEDGKYGVVEINTKK